MVSVSQAIDHIRNRPYMSGVERDRVRVKATGEVFTPSWLAIEGLRQIEKQNPDAFSDPSKTFIDPAAGDGTLLGEALIRKLENGIDFETALSTIYGVDLMQDNVELCRERLLCGVEELRHIVMKNIVCNDATTYDYLFGESEIFGNGLFEIG